MGTPRDCGLRRSRSVTNARRLQRGTLGRYPYGALGNGAPIVVLAGLMPATGVEEDSTVRFAVGPLAALADRRRLVVLNRRPGLPRGMTMAELAAEHAQALRVGLPAPVDVVGTSTGGSIAQQLAADHPEVVRRLALVSTACRLGPEGRRLQRRVAARVRAGARGQALALLGASLVPPGRGQLVAGLAGRLIGPRLVPDAQGLDDMATTIEAEDSFDLAACPPIRAPTLILAGREDRFYAPELFAETARLIPGSRLYVLDGRGHITVMRDRRFATELTAFLG
jgi:pimeloyl-ACP methyl ester carboxylesterase